MSQPRTSVTVVFEVDDEFPPDAVDRLKKLLKNVGRQHRLVCRDIRLGNLLDPHARNVSAPNSPRRQ